MQSKHASPKSTEMQARPELSASTGRRALQLIRSVGTVVG